MACVSLVLCLLLHHVVRTSQQVNSHYTYGQEAIKESDYQIVYPIKVNTRGDFVSHNVHHRLVKRSSSNVHYKMLFGDEDVHIELKPNGRLVGPGMVVERRSTKLANMSSHIQMLSKTLCHFHGNIRQQSPSAVALSTCNGLRGFIHTSNGTYFIEPVKDHNFTEEPRHPHLLYRRSTIETIEKKKTDNCFTKDPTEFAFDRREHWEESGQKSAVRKRRSISTERNVETLVVADKLMMDYYSDEDIEAYILTVMNMVSALFRDASIGNVVNIVVVRILLLDNEDSEEEINISHHADETLKSFCKWQKHINPKEENHPNHHDVAILLTRYNICSRMNEPCSTLGLAEIAGMCQPHRSCNVNEDMGLAVAYTIAHEMGHNFGMTHDGPHNGCQAPFGVRQHVMSPHLNSDTTPLIWSNCSRQQITQFLDRDWGRCLDDEPSQHDFNFPELPPGTMYDTDHQCRLQYGPHASYCHGIEDVCLTLWCRLGNKCVTRLEPAATGTQCGKNKWCFKGHCTVMGERPEVIDGEWGEWMEWTQCTRPCGGGVMTSKRLCNNPTPSNGGRYCVGERKRYKMCNTQPCADGTPSFKEIQCANHNQIPYKDKRYNWLPATSPGNPCQLHCTPKGTFYSVMLSDTVEDGTPCNPGTRDVCINGKCRTVACDWGIDSTAKEDRCGICHGDGTQCQTNKGEFMQEDGIGYVHVFDIPIGARNVRIEEVEDASNYIAVCDDKNNYYLNGNWFIQWGGEYSVPGSTIFYKREGERETLHIPGPILQKLQVLLLFQTKNPGLVYEYVTSSENLTRKPEFHWEYTSWQVCTSSCGGGVQISSAYCMEKEGGLVEDIFCKFTSKPRDIIRTCNKHQCPARWWTGPWQHCSKSCGNDGLRKRSVLCVRSFGNDDEHIALNSSECKSDPKPTEFNPCQHKNPCPEDKKVINCSCSDSAHQRLCSDEMCVEKKDDCNSDLCSSSSANLTTKNENKSEETFSLINSNTTRINSTDKKLHTLKTFGEGSDDHIGLIKPISDSKQHIQNDKNSSQQRPKSEILSSKNRHHSKTLKSLTDERPRGFIEDKIDPEDFKVFAVENKSSYREYHSLLTNELFPEGVNILDFQSQTIVPSTNEDEINHISDIKNNEKKHSNVKPQFEWKIGNWNECSKQCGGGHRARELLCYEVTSTTLVSAEECDLHNRPLYMETCNLHPCTVWNVTEWSTCSTTCGDGLKSRSVQCPKSSTCDEDLKPQNQTLCHIKLCIDWVAGPWSQCPVSCGGALQFRHVSCVNYITQKLSTGCDFKNKPSLEQSCNVDECPQEKSARFTSCVDKMDGAVCASLQHMCTTWYFKTKCCYTCKNYNSVKT